MPPSWPASPPPRPARYLNPNTLYILVLSFFTTFAALPLAFKNAISDFKHWENKMKKREGRHGADAVPVTVVPLDIFIYT